MSDEPLRIIQYLIAPVVMISANGLICLAFYNRLAAVVGRMRAFHKEHYDLAARLASLNGRDAAEARHYRRRMRVLDQLGHQMLNRVKLLRNALQCLLLTILLMLVCSLDLGLAPYLPALGVVAPVLFAAGVVAMGVGVAIAMLELSRAFHPLVFEREMFAEFGDEPPASAPVTPAFASPKSQEESLARVG